MRCWSIGMLLGLAPMVLAASASAQDNSPLTLTEVLTLLERVPEARVQAIVWPRCVSFEADDRFMQETLRSGGGSVEFVTGLAEQCGSRARAERTAAAQAAREREASATQATRQREAAAARERLNGLATQALAALRGTWLRHGGVDVPWEQLGWNCVLSSAFTAGFDFTASDTSSGEAAVTGRLTFANREVIIQGAPTSASGASRVSNPCLRTDVPGFNPDGRCTVEFCHWTDVTAIRAVLVPNSRPREYDVEVTFLECRPNAGSESACLTSDFYFPMSRKIRESVDGSSLLYLNDKGELLGTLQRP